MNDFFAADKAESNKFWQSSCARDVGMRTIPTLYTDEPGEFVSFVEAVGSDVAVKPLVGWNAKIDASDETVGTYTQRLSLDGARSLAHSVASAPVIVQPYVDKAFELRVTVVGEVALACRIDSQSSEVSATDWRHYDFERVAHDPYALSEHDADALVALVKRMGLRFAAVDLIITVKGETIFVEANPSGQFGWIEALSGIKITAAIADWCLGEPRPDRDYFP